MVCLFSVVDVLIWCLSQHISVKKKNKNKNKNKNQNQNKTKQKQTNKQQKQKNKKTFLSRTERFGSFLFCFLYSNLGLPRARSLQNRGRSFLLSQRKIQAGNHPQIGFPSDGYDHN